MYDAVNISFISSYIPRQCGIATYTNDLASSLIKLMPEQHDNVKLIQVAAVNNIPEGYKYGAEVKFEIKEQNLNDYKEAAYFLNLSPAEVINIQHEFGIFGGQDGSNIITLTENLNKPLVTTFHTILSNPSTDQLRIIKELANYSSYVVVLSRRAIRMLEKIYKILPSKIVYIPHGAPDVPFLDPAYYKHKFDLDDKKVIMTFGLIGPGKGIEDVIEALPVIIKKFSNVAFVIVGATHPNIKRINGEEYRDKLENIVKQNSLEKHVTFINRFVDNRELLELLLMSDIYICPYHNKEQIVSGTLSYALACGKAIISTPFWYAEEMLKTDKGILIPFKSPESIAEAVITLLSDETKRNRYRKNAYDSSREMVWSNVAAKYHALYKKAIEGYSKFTELIPVKDRYTSFPSLPEINLGHLITLTDSTGVIQFSKYNIPNRSEGYTTDDNARALLVAFLSKIILNTAVSDKLINTYLAFILHAYNEKTGLFRNFMTYDRKWLEKSGSEECNANVLYVLGYLIKNSFSDSLTGIAKTLFDNVIPKTVGFTSPRAFALISMGCIFYLNRFSGAREVKKICKDFCEKLHSLYLQHSDDNWKWFEDIVTYNNGRLPQSMIMAGRFFKNDEYISAGIESLQWLYDIQYDREKKMISLIGNKGWYPRSGVKARYDQQPVEIPALIDACWQAYIITKSKDWISKIGIIFSWFLGNNDRHNSLYDYTTGGCYDGLSVSVTNQNQGAESTICWLISLLRMIRIREELQIK